MQASQKNQNIFQPTRSPRQQWPPRWKKNGDLLIVFSVQGTGGSPTRPDPENRVGGQGVGSPGRPVSSGLQVPGEPGHCDLPAAFFHQNVLQLHQQRWAILRIYNLVLWKIIKEEDAVLIPKKSRLELSSGFLHSEFFGREEPLCPHSINCCFISET